MICTRVALARRVHHTLPIPRTRRRSPGARLARAMAAGAILAALAVLSRPGPARAQPAGDPPARARAAGDYQGVVPGGEAEIRPAKGLPANRITWLGFQPRADGSARLFIQLTSEASYTQEVKDGVLVIKLEGVRFQRTRRGRRLDTRYFDTALAQVTSRRVHKRRARRSSPAQTAGVELRIEFKNPPDVREAQATMQAEEDGYHYLYLDFGPSGVRVSE